MNRIAHKHYSYLLVGGPDCQIFWCLLVNIGKTHYGIDPPRYTEKDKELALEHENDMDTQSPSGLAV